MKKHLFGALAILAIASCNEPVVPDGPQGFDAKQLKVAVEGKALGINDEIVVFNGISGENQNAAARYQCVAMEEGMATFEFLPGDDVAQINRTCSEVVVLYPPQEAAYDAASGKLSYTFSGDQSFVGKGSPKNTIELKPTCGGVDLKLSGLSTIKSIDITSSLALRGACEVDMNVQAPELRVTSSTTTATLNLVPSVVLVESGKTISMVFPAGTYQSLSFNSHDANGGNMVTPAENVVVKVGETTTVSDSYFVPTAVDSLAVDITKYLAAVGKTFSLEGLYKVLPEDATNKKAVFSSSDESVASVSAEGVVSAKAVGNAVITIASEDDNTKSVSVAVRVADIPEFAEVTRSTPVTIHSCDNLDYMTKLGNNHKAIISTSNPKEGTGYFFNTSEKGMPEWMAFSKTSSAVDGKILSANRAHLTFWFYISPFSFKKSDGTTATMTSRLTAGKGHIELTSTGNNAWGPYWTTTEVLRGNALKEDGSYGNIDEGWNFIDLPFKDARHDLGTTEDNKGFINTQGINYFRFYIEGAACTWDEYDFGFDNIAIYEDYAQETKAEKEYLHNLENLAGFSNAYYNAAEQAVGAVLPEGIQTFPLYLPESVASRTTKKYGHIHFKMYVSDVEAFSDNNFGQFELTSSGTCDKEEISWSVTQIGKCLHNGWNDVVLDFNRAAWSDDFRPENVNFFRFYDKFQKPVTVQFKDIYLFNETFDK